MGRPPGLRLNGRRMLEALREPRTLLFSIGGGAALLATGFLAAMVMVGGPAVDAGSTGSVRAALASPAPNEAEPTRLKPAIVPATPDNLLVLAAPDPEAAPPSPDYPRGSLAFQSALDVMADGDAVRAFHLARALADPAERHAIQWAAVRDGNGSIDYEAVIRFVDDAPAFATGPVIRTRLEQALLRADAEGPEIIRALGGAMPNTIDAQIALALAYVADGQKARAAQIARAIWVGNFLTRDEENRVHKRLGALLTAGDHWDRAVNLMMHDRASGVDRLLTFMTEAQKSLAVARNAVSRNRKDAKALLDKVDASMQGHPVYLFSRAQRARQFEHWDEAVTWLNKATGDLPASAEWWYERRTVVRALMAQEDYELAFKAADRYRRGPEGRLVDAHFHAGWIALTYLDAPKAAVEHFELMAANSTLQDSVTQANYWLGRARRAAGDEAGALKAFAEATRFGTVYYGLLARDELGHADGAAAAAPALVEMTGEEDVPETLQAARLFAANGDSTRALTLLRSFAYELDDGEQLRAAAETAERLGAHDLAISIAETAERKGFPLDAISFPNDAVPTNMVAEVDPAAIFAVARQESRFRSDAVSSAGARGLMQLMPATARETAHKVGLEYSKARLTADPAYNALLGSTYLADQLATFDRSLLLAATAYNAGPGNARKWIRQFGDPRSDAVDPVVWVELIPYQETRKYVQRVLGNYLVYRARFGRDELTMTDALRFIPG